MTIYEIKRQVESTGNTYFGRKELKCFGQTLKDFKVYKQIGGKYLITAPMRNKMGKIIGESKRYFNPEDNKLENTL